MANKSANFTVDDGDHFGGYFVTTTTAATVIATLPAAGSTNKGRTVPFIKVDATTGNVQITVDGGGHLGGLWDSLYLINQGDSLTAISDGTLWQVKGPIQPVAGEHSLGTPHPHIYQYAANLYSNTAPGAATFQTVTVAGLPAGTKAIEIVGYIVNGAAGEECRWRPYGSADTSAQSAHRMLGIRPAGGTAYCGIRGMVTVDSAGKFDICVTDANDDIHVRGYSIYWL